MHAVTIFVFFAGVLRSLAWEPALTATSSAQVVSAISSELPDVFSGSITGCATFAGYYADPGGFSCNRLYLFPNETYMFTHAEDMIRETIYEKGKWVLRCGAICITPDRSLPYDGTVKDHRFLPLYLRGQTNMFLLGANWGYSYLIENIATNDYFLFKLCAFELKEQYDGKKGETVMTKLVKRAWRPEWFKD